MLIVVETSFYNAYAVDFAGIPELVEKLQRQGKAVFLVSGGFRVIIDPIAKLLDLPNGHVFANTILHKVSFQVHEYCRAHRLRHSNDKNQILQCTNC